MIGSPEHTSGGLRVGPERGWFYPIWILGTTWVYLWPVVYFWGQQYALATGLILFNVGVCLTYHRRTPRAEWGFFWPDFLPGLRWAIFLTIPILLLIFWMGHSSGTLVGRKNPALDLVNLFLWTLFQQLALQTVLLRELKKRFSHGRAILLGAVLFSLLHLPNPFLMPATFLGGIVWCSLYTRYPNLLPIALSHSLCTLMILASLPRQLTGGLRVGYSYFLLNGG